MPIEIAIPRLGWSMDEGNFTAWIKKEGETVKAGEPLFTMESEKASQDIEAVDSGILKFLPEGPQPGDLVKVGQVIGHLLEADESAAGSTKSQNAVPTSVAPTERGKTEKANQSSAAPVPAREGAPAQAGQAAAPVSPRARRRAAALGVDTSQIQVTGKGGRIVEADVIRAADIQFLEPPDTLV